MRKYILVATLAFGLLARTGSANADMLGYPCDLLCQQNLRMGLDRDGFPIGQPRVVYPEPTQPQRIIQVSPDTYRDLDASGPGGAELERAIIVPPQPMSQLR